MNRRAFVTGLGAVLAAPLAVDAQQPARVWRIGWLANDPDLANPYFRYFKDQLRSHGYVEGQTVEFLYALSLSDTERASHLAREVVSRKPDLLVAVAPPAAHAAKNATASVPIVVVAVGRAVQLVLMSAGLLKLAARTAATLHRRSRAKLHSSRS